MLDLIDKLAGWWLDWRMDRAVAANPELQQAGFKRAEFDENGFHLVASFPEVYLLADGAAAMLEANNAKNYVQFDMLPRADRHLPPIRVTVQWASGKSPAQRVLELEAAWMTAERLVSNGPAVAEGLRQAGYQSLALQTEQDIEILAALVTDAARERAST